MPNIKSAKKRVITSQKRARANASAKSALRTHIKKAKISITNGDEKAQEVVKTAAKKIDQAAAKGLIHKNTAARRKSKLAKALNAKAAQ